MTIVIGVVAAFVAGFVLSMLGYGNANGGPAWIAWIVGALLAAGGIVLYGNMTNKRV